MDINEYIKSGILEAYRLGYASDEEVDELDKLTRKHPQIKDALDELDSNLEDIAQHMAVAPPPGRWNKIEAELNEIIKRTEADKLKITSSPKNNNSILRDTDQGEFIQLLTPTNQIRIHKLWKLLVVGLIALGLVFLCFAIYFSSKNKQNNQQINELKQELKKQ
ncbi:hypothetical protein [Pedobacter nyackensis]|uniref:hypothetical protein n=1 Tax=Pedobacter nyackensis TaxID=475255 RepID=UPI002930F495|nr:hypothetical protein [Pedobacter nyackensis]